MQDITIDWLCVFQLAHANRIVSLLVALCVQWIHDLTNWFMGFLARAKMGEWAKRMGGALHNFMSHDICASSLSVFCVLFVVVMTKQWRNEKKIYIQYKEKRCDQMFMFCWVESSRWCDRLISFFFCFSKMFSDMAIWVNLFTNLIRKTIYTKNVLVYTGLYRFSCGFRIRIFFT